jgi:hypothetical protein
MISRRTTLFSFFVAILTVGALFVVPGCGGTSESSVAGTYDLDKEAVKKAMQAEIDKQSGEDAGMAEMGAAFALGMVDMMTMTLTLNADKTATMNMSAMGDTDVATGTWSLSGDTITLTIASQGETPEPVTGTVDGDTITITPPAEDEMPFNLVFKKKS